MRLSSERLHLHLNFRWVSGNLIQYACLEVSIPLKSLNMAESYCKPFNTTRAMGLEIHAVLHKTRSHILHDHSRKMSSFLKDKFYSEPSRLVRSPDKYTTTHVLTASDSQRNGTISLDKPSRAGQWRRGHLSQGNMGPSSLNSEIPEL